MRLGWDQSACQRPNNQQGINWKNPGRQSIRHIQLLILEEEKVVKDADQQDDGAVYPIHDLERLNQPWSGMGDAVRLHAVQYK